LPPAIKIQKLHILVTFSLITFCMSRFATFSTDFEVSIKFCFFIPILHWSTLKSNADEKAQKTKKTYYVTVS
jgi:hypothetical protein